MGSVKSSAARQVGRVARSFSDLSLSDGKQRNQTLPSIVAIPGANALLRPADAAGGGHVPVTCSSGNLKHPSTARAFFAAGRAAGATTTLNAAPAIPCRVNLLAMVDVLVVNELQLTTCIRRHITSRLDDHGIIEEARLLQARAAQTVVVTLGARGAIAVAGSDIHTVPGRRVPVADTTGAGDCFVGTLVARRAAGSTPPQALTFANAAASICVQRPGAGAWMPTAAEVELAVSAAT
jgi:ribokinase